VTVARGHAPLELLVGEVRTGLLRHSVPLAVELAAELLGLVPDGRARVSTRPISQVSSPRLVSGVNCLLPTGSGTRIDAIGTVLTSAAVTGGRVLQGSTWTVIGRRQWDFRPPWSHFLASPGTLHARGRADSGDLVAGFLRGEPRPTASASLELDLGASAGRAVDRVQNAPGLDRRAGLRARRTRLRFAVRLDTPDPTEHADSTVFVMHDDDVLRTITCAVPGGDATEVVRLCEDLALHDWLLTTVARIVDVSRADVESGEDAVRHLRPAVTHLLPLWMPGAHVAAELMPIWVGLDRRPGFTRQWENLVAEIRDRLSLAMITLLGRGSDERAGAI
jgi:hypothetical protein